MQPRGHRNRPLVSPVDIDKVAHLHDELHPVRYELRVDLPNDADRDGTRIFIGARFCCHCVSPMTPNDHDVAFPRVPRPRGRRAVRALFPLQLIA